MALEIVSREFYRESDHRDIQFAEACHQTAQLIFMLVTRA
jgi:hypothetical protein